jgi:hypothetical protein
VVGSVAWRSGPRDVAAASGSCVSVEETPGSCVAGISVEATGWKGVELGSIITVATGIDDCVAAGAQAEIKIAMNISNDTALDFAVMILPIYSIIDLKLLYILSKDEFNLLLSLMPDPLMKDVPISVEQVKARSDLIAQILPKICRKRIADFEIGKFDPAEIRCFEPMDHGRHLLAGYSPKFEEFDELQSARRHGNRRGIRSFEFRAARSRNGNRRWRGRGLGRLIERRNRGRGTHSRFRIHTLDKGLGWSR